MILARKGSNLVTGLIALLALGRAAAAINIQSAPSVDATAIATSVITANFDSCKRVTGAKRQNDGSILAKCRGAEYLVFTTKVSKTGATQPVALNCEAAKTRLGILCRK
jgi:hypothetical protein